MSLHRLEFLLFNLLSFIQQERDQPRLWAWAGLGIQDEQKQRALALPEPAGECKRPTPIE